VLAGDIVIKVGGQDAAALGYDKTIEALRGENGTNVVFTVSRGGKQIEFNFQRTAYTAKTVESKVIGNNIGFIRIHQFGKNTTEEFRVALEDLINTKKVGSLIFDVRNNPGGLLDSVAKVIDRLVPKGNIVSATYKDGTTKVLFKSDDTEVKLPMAVLVNENSASAAELFSCALKDYNKAVLVGVNTYGKGTMQDTISLGDGTSLNLSVAKYNPPKSPNFDGKGVAPNIIIQMPENLKQHMYELTVQNDLQLTGAINALTSNAK
jgi:carboxyl-terminal processing protease